MNPPNTVIERGLGGPICGECAHVLPVVGQHARICLLCHPEYEFNHMLDERELGILAKGMIKRDQSAVATVKHWVRLGQLVDHFKEEGFDLLFRHPESGKYVDPFDQGPKMAPMPYCGGAGCKQLQHGMTFHDENCPEREGKR